jgi:hypothetical protein
VGRGGVRGGGWERKMVEQKCTRKEKRNRVNLFVIEHILMIKHFPIFSLFINGVEPIWCHWKAQSGRATNVLLASEIKEQCRKHKKRMHDSLH